MSSDMKLGVAEILENAGKLKSRKDKIEYLQRNRSEPLLKVLGYCFHPSVKWLLPEGVPPYKPNDLEDLEHVFYSEARKLYLFLEGGNDGLRQVRREQLFIELLESVAPADAKLLCSIKDKKMPIKGITYKLAQEAFPSDLQLP